MRIRPVTVKRFAITLVLVVTAVFAYGLWVGAKPYFINEINPMAVFRRMYGDGSSLEERRARREANSSIQDKVTRKLARFEQNLPADDRHRLDAYLDPVRDLGKEFWKMVAVYVCIFAWAIVWVRTRKGLIHWIGVVLIALGAMLDAIPGWIKDVFIDAVHRFPAAARARLVELPRSE